MKKLDLLYYFNLAQNIATARKTLAIERQKTSSVYFAVSSLQGLLEAFPTKAVGFTATKHSAKAMVAAIRRWDASYMELPNGTLDFTKFEVEINKWEWYELTSEIETLQVVFTAECNDVEIYSVSPLSIYNITALVSQASERFPAEYKDLIPVDALLEFDNAGRCLAFNLPTASGFHSLRGVELCILAYLRKRQTKVERLKSWNQYFQAIEKLEKEASPPHQPSPKVAAMVQRMKDLDRNPLMHPNDTLDISGADQLFNLASVTVIELAKDDYKLQDALKSVETLPSPPIQSTQPTALS